ncbi:unnamed protein product [Cunninghamella blakesleeana]
MPAERKKHIYMQTKESNVIYENWKVYNKTGKLMFRCNEKKANWYLKRNLANTLPQEQSIELTFEAKGDGHDLNDYMVEEQSNNCVVCNATKELTTHHVVPDMYRKAMPLCIKSKSSRDLLLLCKQCHDQYEDDAIKLKKEIVKQYDCPLEGKGWIHSAENRYVRKAATALLRCKEKLPENRIKELEDKVKAYQSSTPYVSSSALPPLSTSSSESSSELVDEIKEVPLTDLSWDDLLNTCSKLKDMYHGPDFIDHGTFVVQQLMGKGKTMDETTFNERWPELESFIKLWRKHFLDHLQPKYLSKKWTIDGEIYNY